MIARLVRLLARPAEKHAWQADELRLAAAGLLAEAARADGALDGDETRRIQAALVDRFGLTPADAAELFAAGVAGAEAAVDLYGFTRVLKNRLNHEERVKLLEALWEIVYADGKAHTFEASLLRRVTGLIYVSDQESGAARKRAIARLAGEKRP